MLAWRQRQQVSPKAWCHLYKLTWSKNTEIFWKLPAVKSWKPIGHEVLFSNQDWIDVTGANGKLLGEKKLMAQQPLVYKGLLIIETSRSQTHYTRYDSSDRVISPAQRRPPGNTQHSQETDIHAPGRIRTHNPSKRVVADLRLRPRDNWDRHE
jgi:hypothetical protein